MYLAKINKKMTSDIKLLSTQSVLKVSIPTLLLIFSAMVPGHAYYHSSNGDDSTSQNVNSSLTATAKSSGNIYCQGMNGNKEACKDSKNLADTHSQKAKALANIADKQQGQADKLQKNVNNLVTSNPSLAHTQSIVADQAQTAANLTTAAAHAHATAAASLLKCAASLTNHQKIDDCNLNGSQNKAACLALNKTKVVHEKAGKMIDNMSDSTGNNDSDAHVVTLTPECSLAVKDSKTADDLTLQAQKATDTVSQKVNTAQKQQDDQQKGN